MNNFFIHILSWLRYDKIFRKKKKNKNKKNYLKKQKSKQSTNIQTKYERSLKCNSN